MRSNPSHGTLVVARQQRGNELTTGSIQFSYDVSTGIRTAAYSGAVGDALLIAAYRNLIRQSDFVPLAHDLADLRGVTTIALTPAGLNGLGLLLPGGGQPKPPNVSGLAIVANTPESRGIAQMFAQMSESCLPKDTRVFDSIDEARAWLKSLPRLA